MEELKLRADLDKGRADFSDRLLKCRTEEEVYDLTLDFFEKSYGIENGMVLLKRDGKFVFVKFRLKRKGGEQDHTALIRRTGYIASDSSNPLVVFFHELKTKMGYVESMNRVFEDLRLTESHAGLQRFLEDIETQIPLTEGERISAIKIPEVGMLCGTVTGSRIRLDQKSRELVVNTISAIIKEIRLEKTREKIRKRNEIFHNLDMDLYKIPMGNIKKKLHTIIAQLAKFVDADKIQIYMPDPENPRQLNGVSSFGRLRKSQTECTQNVVQHVYETGDEICIPAADGSDVQPIPYPGVLFGKEVQRQIEEHYRAFFSAPIKGDFGKKREILGVIIISTAEVVSAEDKYMIYDFINLLSGQIKDELLYERERELATKDELTGLNNRRYFLGRADELFKISKRYGKKFSVIMMDIDFFKDINDTYGHEAGDQVLKALADVFRRLIREVDVLGRYGGEEFILLLPETDMSGAVNIAERIRKTVEKMQVPFEGEKIRFTISCGVASYGENSRYLQGVSYQVRLEGGSIQVFVDDQRIAAVRLKVTELDEEERLGLSIGHLFKGDLDADEKRNHVKELLRKLVSLDGLISIADGRLYKSKVMGRNRVTTGPW
jgi:diguanylate cyclase (GGDEF)-like protein